MSPFLGMVIGAIVTIIVLILLIAIRIRSQNSFRERPLEQKMVSLSITHNQTTAKPANRITEPRDPDEMDPDVIPAKYGNAFHKSNFGNVYK